MFISDDDNWVNLLTEAITTYINNIHLTINMSPVNASNHPEKVNYIITSSNSKLKGKSGYAQLKAGDCF